MFYFGRRLNSHRPEFSQKRFTLTLVLCTFVVLSTISTWWIERQLSGPIREWARLRAITVATTAINDAIGRVLPRSLENLEPFRYHQRGDNESPLISYNMGPLNQVMSEAVASIVSAFQEPGHDIFHIPIGEISGLHLLAGWGPTIPARIHTTGGVEAKPKIDFHSVGINQVIHRLYIDVTVRMVVIAPFMKDDIIISQSIILSEEIIPGRIPDTYVNLVGYSGDYREWLAMIAASEDGRVSQSEAIPLTVNP